MYFSDAGISSIMLDSDIEKQVSVAVDTGVWYLFGTTIDFFKGVL